MSVLAALARAYERLAVNDAMPMIGYSSQSIYGCIVVNTDGTLAGPPAIWDPDPRGRPSARSINVPYFGGRSGKTPPPYFLWDNTAYVLGVTRKDFDAKGRFEAFKALHERYIADAADEGLTAVLRFLNQWNADDFHALGFPETLIDRNFVFRLAGDRGFVHERDAARDLWVTVNEPDTTGNGVCLVTGEHGPVARLHPPLVSFENPARIVAFDKDNDAFASYGHIQGENAPIGISAAFAYSAALNKFLERSSKNRIQIGDTSTVFWADASDAEAAELAEGTVAAMLGGEIDEGAQAKRVGALLEQIRKGKPLADLEPRLAEGVRFYVLGLAPNAARLSIRYWFEDDFGVIARNYQRYVADMRIEPPPQDPYPPLWRYLVETAVLGKRENVPPNLAGEWLRAILTGTRYPLTLLATVLMRIRADHEVNGLRVGLLKSILIRNFNREVPVALDPDNRDKGYLLGRLFALYEYIQTAALGGKVNATIRDKFYGAASAQPRKVFPLLDRGSANHLSKVGKGSPGRKVNLDRQLGQIMDRMAPDGDPFPASLSSAEQALFSLGYYHQRNDFFKTRKDLSEGDAA